MHEGHLQQGRWAAGQQSPIRLSFLEKLTWTNKGTDKSRDRQGRAREQGKGLLERFRKGGERKYKFLSLDNTFTAGSSLLLMDHSFRLLSGSHTMQKAIHQSQLPSAGTASFQCCWLMGNLSLPLQTIQPLEVFRISALFSPLPILEYRQSGFILGSPKEKSDQHTASIENSGS